MSVQDFDNLLTPRTKLLVCFLNDTDSIASRVRTRRHPPPILASRFGQLPEIFARAAFLKATTRATNLLGGACT